MTLIYELDLDIQLSLSSFRGRSMSSRPVYRTCAQLAPSGECLRGYKPRLAPRVAASCPAKPSCYTWPACRYLCCPAWQLVCVCIHCIDLFSCCKAASVFFYKLTYILKVNLQTEKNFLGQGFQKLKHYRQTDTQRDWKH